METTGIIGTTGMIHMDITIGIIDMEIIMIICGHG